MPSGPPGEKERWPRIVAGVIVALFVAAIVVKVTVARRLPDDFEGSTIEDLGLLSAFGAFALTGALLLAKRPRHSVSWMVAAVGVLPSLFVSLDTYGAWVQTTGRQVDPLVVFGFWGQEWYWFLVIALLTVFVPLYFPDGHLPSRRWRPWAAIPVLSTAALVIAGMTQPTIASHVIDGEPLDNPIGIPGMMHVEDELGLLFVGVIFGLGLAIAAVIVRFRRSRGAERQQLKVFLFAVGLLPLMPLGDVIPVLQGHVVPPLVVAAIPVAVTVAVLRYRLYDIDRVISRTLAYALLTAVLVGVYAAGILGIGGLLPGEPSDLLVAGSTLAAAALFRPLRSRIQGLVDRRFNRARYDAARLVEDFGRRLRDRVDLDEVAVELNSTAARALHPQHVTLFVVAPTVTP